MFRKVEKPSSLNKIITFLWKFVDNFIIMYKEIENLAEIFVENYKKNNKVKTNWDSPILAFANAKDPMFLRLKHVIGQEHKLPNELMSTAQTIITYFVPFNQEVVLSNVGGIKASRKWALAYIETNKLLNNLTRSLSNTLQNKNYECFEIPPTHNFDKTTLKGYWSHKHVAYIAGLGRFGLHKMLITEKGCCGRLGSLITSARIEATERKINEYCLYYQNNSCKQCIARCTFDILKNDSFDRHKCYNVCLENGKLYSALGLSDMCGKCACGVPCSLKNPC